MIYVPCFAVDDMDRLMDNEYAQLFYYGFCREIFFVVLFLICIMIKSEIHVLLPSGQKTNFSIMYINDIDFAVDQLLVLLHRFV